MACMKMTRAFSVSRAADSFGLRIQLDSIATHTFGAAAYLGGLSADADKPRAINESSSTGFDVLTGNLGGSRPADDEGLRIDTGVWSFSMQKTEGVSVSLGDEQMERRYADTALRMMLSLPAQQATVMREASRGGGRMHARPSFQSPDSCWCHGMGEFAC
jgi:hypothetical protein